ncbi:hypothetical protein KEM55_003122 [Ascosphaera atra]|nr:hypothetical protein KEM55_003122 [Ascosphaera atra]
MANWYLLLTNTITDEQGSKHDDVATESSHPDPGDQDANSGAENRQVITILQKLETDMKDDVCKTFGFNFFLALQRVLEVFGQIEEAFERLNSRKSQPKNDKHALVLTMTLLGLGDMASQTEAEAVREPLAQVAKILEDAAVEDGNASYYFPTLIPGELMEQRPEKVRNICIQDTPCRMM